ncbi:MAG: hypothetical protein WBM00_00875 [Solirubrobacterales bacterium]
MSSKNAREFRRLRRLQHKLGCLMGNGRHPYDNCSPNEIQSEPKSLMREPIALALQAT